MRWLAIVLCLAGSARADLASGPAAAGTLAGFPATDGRSLAFDPSVSAGRVSVTMVDLESHKSEGRQFASISALRTALANFAPMRSFTFASRKSEMIFPTAAFSGEQRMRYDRRAVRLHLRGPIRRSVDLMLRDVCMDIDRASMPDDLTVSIANGVILIEAAAHGGSCLCEDRGLTRVVTSAGQFDVRWR